MHPRVCERARPARRWCAPVADTASGIVARVAKNMGEGGGEGRRDRGVISFSYRQFHDLHTVTVSCRSPEG